MEVVYRHVAGGQLLLLESITESPFTWCIPHAWLEFALGELQAGVTVVQVGPPPVTCWASLFRKGAPASPSDAPAALPSPTLTLTSMRPMLY